MDYLSEHNHAYKLSFLQTQKCYEMQQRKKVQNDCSRDDMKCKSYELIPE